MATKIKQKYHQYKLGYTLVEIMVVISIMAILTAVIYSSFDTSKANSRDQKRVGDLSVIQLALEQFFQKYGVYPVQLSELVDGKKDVSPVIKFLPEIPADLPPNTAYNYFPMTKMPMTTGGSIGSNNCVSYQLWTTFEGNNEHINSRRIFNSTNLSDDVFECGPLYNHPPVDASSNDKIYDVMP